jgi:hypothetical protein
MDLSQLERSHFLLSSFFLSEHKTEFISFVEMKFQTSIDNICGPPYGFLALGDDF